MSNGLDDNCDHQVDEDDPPGIPCPVPGLLGACRQGMTSCATLPLTCDQTVFPVDEVACNQIDDDCDGQVDGSYVFGNVPIVKDNFSLVALGIVAVSLLPMAIEMGASAEDLKMVIHPHPTLSETMHESVLDAFGRVIHV